MDMAVTLWSPVIITGRMPACLALATAWRDSGLGGSIMAVSPRNTRLSSSLPDRDERSWLFPAFAPAKPELPCSFPSSLKGRHAKARTRSPLADQRLFWSSILWRSEDDKVRQGMAASGLWPDSPGL